MALASAQVIDALVALLATVTSSAGRVYPSRLWPITEAELPAWRVTAENEAVEPANIKALELHTLDVSARGFVRATADVDDAMHALAAAGLTKLFSGTPPNYLACTGIRREVVQQGEASMGAITLELQARFYTQAGAPETII